MLFFNWYVKWQKCRVIASLAREGEYFRTKCKFSNNKYSRVGVKKWGRSDNSKHAYFFGLNQ
jgi:hypothetical protein